jgi:hypothetical protein
MRNTATINDILAKYKDDPAVYADLSALVIAATLETAEATKAAAVEFIKAPTNSQQVKALKDIIAAQRQIIGTLKALHTIGGRP